MHNPSPVPGTAARESRETKTAGEDSAAPGSLAEPGSAAQSPAPARRADSPAEAEGRRTLSTAFVWVGPGGHLTVELRDGRVIVLRDVVMGPRDYCGVQVVGGSAGKRYCGGYGDVAAARPSGGPSPDVLSPASLDSVRSPNDE